MAVASHLGDEQVSDPQTLGISNAAANGGKGTLFADCLGIIASDLEGEELVKYIKLRPHYLPSLEKYQDKEDIPTHKRDNLIALSKKVIRQCRTASFTDVMNLINFYLIITCVQQFDVDKTVEVEHICKTWRDLLHLPCSQTVTCELKWAKECGQYSAKIGGLLVCINQYSEMVIPHFNVVQSGKAMKGATYLNPLYHPSAAEYMTTIKSSKLTHVPLMNVHIVGKVDSHTDQISEGSFNLWKNYDMPQRQRLDVAWTKLSDRSDAKIGRFMVELQTSLRLELQRKAKENLDHVSKLNRDKEELNMYKLFEDCLRYAWGDYNRKYIVKQFESWNRKEDGDIKWNISFNVGSIIMHQTHEQKAAE
eukprot:641906_1